MAGTETRLLIGGERVAGEGAPLAVENPTTEWWYPYGESPGGQ
jgi:hypothetical protein